MTEENGKATQDDGASVQKKLTPAAQRALAEAEARRKDYLAAEAERPKELSGRGGLEPGRYGDWEVKGLTADF
ncbi:hypothetical protein ASD64_19660 [Mesorhizobium sp. Root157]|uniref:DUF1674 domain-containing protein n=1 Tax=Mesorhizobium sp. Root157 TaxID=1736477 RepID=UPI0006FCAD90|nr:DUF1674 domain-containing protein [Mesorhizobium sp. Root157]KQZ91462.1 hypothetical protein ASD64_19660 [Mesorhizobium sp. Root157]